MRRAFFTLFLVVYSSLPGLFTGIAVGMKTAWPPVVSGLPFAAGLIFFAVPPAATGVLFRIRRRRQAFTAAVNFFLFLLIGGLLLGYTVHPFFYTLLLLYPGPILALSYSLVYRFSRRQDFTRLSSGITMILLLLFSYSIMLLILKLHHIWVLPGPFEGMDLAVNFYESLNYLPALYILFLLRNSADKTLLVEGGTFRFGNENIGSTLNSREHYILSFLLENPSRSIRCRDLLPFFQDNRGNEKFTCRVDEKCKASLCPGYSIAYRNVSSLGRKLESFGIGSILPPENKRDIVEKGWRLSLFSGVRVKFSKKPPTGRFHRGENPMDTALVFIPDLSGGRTYSHGLLHKRAPLIIAVSLAFFGGLLLAMEAASVVGSADVVFPVVLTVEIGFLMLTILISRQKISFCRSFFGPAALILLSFALIPVIGEFDAFLMALRNTVLAAVFFLLLHPWVETELRTEGFRDRVSGILFWLIWSYMVTFTVFDETVFVSGSRLLEVDFLDMVLILTDRLLLTGLFILTVAFYSLPGKILEIRGEDLFFQKKAIHRRLSRINQQLLMEFLISPEGILYCREILERLEPEKAGICDTACKPSVCRHYQKIYKRIREIRKFMETAGIGTIVSPDRFSAVHEEGWKLALYEDVKIEIRSLHS